MQWTFTSQLINILNLSVGGRGGGGYSSSLGIASLADSRPWRVNNDGLRMECEQEVIEGTFYTIIYSLHFLPHLVGYKMNYDRRRICLRSIYYQNDHRRLVIKNVVQYQDLLLNTERWHWDSLSRIFGSLYETRCAIHISYFIFHACPVLSLFQIKARRNEMLFTTSACSLALPLGESSLCPKGCFDTLAQVNLFRWALGGRRERVNISVDFRRGTFFFTGNANWCNSLFRTEMPDEDVHKYKQKHEFFTFLNWDFLRRSFSCVSLFILHVLFPLSAR